MAFDLDDLEGDMWANLQKNGDKVLRDIPHHLHQNMRRQKRVSRFVGKEIDLCIGGDVRKIILPTRIRRDGSKGTRIDGHTSDRIAC